MMQLDTMSKEELGRLFPIIISEPMPYWTDVFKAEKLEIENALGLNAIKRIEHIGSTAVAHLKAKPTIDILLEIADDADTDAVIAALKNIEYHYIPKPENPPPHMMLVKGYTIHGFQGQAYHVHVRYQGAWDELYFRDYLIRNPAVAREYADLKVILAEEYKNDRDGYTDKKGEFIKRITGVARKERSIGSSSEQNI
jgi:GrpB-like predicted nucleotidyltransferase (UPF0157 family)